MRGYIQKTQYKVFNDHIEFLTFTAYDNEEFIVEVSDTTKTGNLLVDGSNVSTAGTLAQATTDFNIGTSVPLEGAVTVFRDGIQMFQNTDNSSGSLDGNYYIIPVTGDEGSIIRFNTAAGTGGAAVLVSSNGALVERPNLSMLQDIESVAGQIDAIVPTVAALAGVPETDFQANPNNVDLRNFGDRLVDVEDELDTKYGAGDFKRQHIQQQGSGGLSGTNDYLWNSTIHSGEDDGELFTITDGELILNVDCFIDVEFSVKLNGSVHSYNNVRVSGTTPTFTLSGPHAAEGGGTGQSSMRVLGEYPTGTTFAMRHSSRNTTPEVHIRAVAEVNPFSN